jgi:hypothetical protein
MRNVLLKSFYSFGCMSLLTAVSLATDITGFDMEGNAYVESDGRIFDEGKSFYFTPADGTGQKPLETTVSFRGSNSILFRTSGSSSSRSKDRSEVSIDGYQDIRGQSRYLAFAFKLPSNFSAPTQWFLFSQFHQQNMGSPPLSINLSRNSSNQVSMDLVTRHSAPADEYVERYSQVIAKNTWYRVILQATFSNNGANGKLKLWTNGNLVYSNEALSLGYTSADPGTGTFSPNFKPKIGIYRDGAHGSTDHSIYIDNLRLTTTLSEAQAALQ